MRKESSKSEFLPVAKALNGIDVVDCLLANILQQYKDAAVIFGFFYPS